MEEVLKQILMKLESLEQGQTAIRSDIIDLKEGQTVLTAKVDRIENRLDKLELRLENEVIDKIRALYDARQSQQDINERIINALGRIEAKIDVLQMETASIRRIK